MIRLYILDDEHKKNNLYLHIVFHFRLDWSYCFYIQRTILATKSIPSFFFRMFSSAKCTSKCTIISRNWVFLCFPARVFTSLAEQSQDLSPLDRSHCSTHCIGSDCHLYDQLYIPYIMAFEKKHAAPRYRIYLDFIWLETVFWSLFLSYHGPFISSRTTQQ